MINFNRSELFFINFMLKYKEMKTMFYIRIGQNRLYTIHEFWFLIPASIGIQYFLLNKVNKLEEKRIKSVKQRIQKQNIYEFAIYNYRFELHRLMLLINFRVRGGEFVRTLTNELYESVKQDYYEECKKIKPGLPFINDRNLRDELIGRFRHRITKKGILYITQTALCQKMHGMNFKFNLANQLILVDTTNFGLAVSDTTRFVHKGLTSLLFSSSLHSILNPNQFRILVQYIFRWARIPIPTVLQSPVVISMILIGLTGLSGVIYKQGFEISTTSVGNPFDSIEQRIPGETEVVVMNVKNSQFDGQSAPNKMSECVLPDQKYNNPVCQVPDYDYRNGPVLNSDNVVKTSDIVDISDPTNTKFPEDMKEIMGTTVNEIAEPKETASFNPFTSKSLVKPKPKSRSRVVNFLKEYGDRGPISEEDSWETATKHIRKEKIAEAVDNFLE